MTTPSVTGVEVIGDAFDDVAVNVHFENDAVPDAWFAPQLVTLVDHAVGSHATVRDGSFVKRADSAWVSDAAERWTAGGASQQIQVHVAAGRCARRSVLPL
jgi:hypothetical protein